MEGPPSLDTVIQALDTLYHNPNVSGKEEASIWLGKLQGSVCFAVNYELYIVGCALFYILNFKIVDPDIKINVFELVFFMFLMGCAKSNAYITIHFACNYNSLQAV